MRKRKATGDGKLENHETPTDLAPLPNDFWRHMSMIFTHNATADSQTEDKLLASSASSAAYISSVGEEAEEQSVIPSPVAPETLQMMASLYRTNRANRSIFKPVMDEQVKRLVTLVLHGREEEAKAMIEALPMLLVMRGTGKTKSGRVFENVTAYEAALLRGDTQMCEMMHPFFENKKNGEAERAAQYAKVFPEGVDAVIGAQTSYDFNWLVDVINGASDNDVTAQLKHQQNTSKLCLAFNSFRIDFANLSKQEQHANLKHLLEAYTIYATDPRLDRWEQQNKWDKLDLFWRQVIGFVQLYLPECVKQVFYQGLYDFVEKGKRCERLAEFKFGGGSLHLSSDPSGAGFDFAALGMSGVVGYILVAGERGTRERAPVCCDDFGKLMSNKNIELGRLLPAQTNRSGPCV